MTIFRGNMLGGFQPLHRRGRACQGLALSHVGWLVDDMQPGLPRLAGRAFTLDPAGRPDRGGGDRMAKPVADQ